MRARRALSELTVVLTVCAVLCRAKMIRNSALMNKMMSQFQRDNSDNLSLDPVPLPLPGGGAGGVVTGQRPARVLALMQTVLCKNFPTIPCKLIMQDQTLSRLIQKSIRQINIKKLSLEKTTQTYEHKTKYPLVNSEDLSNFLQVQNTGYFNNKPEKHKRKKQKSKSERVSRSKDKGQSSKKQNGKRTSVYGRKLRKFYPHKVKYKDKARVAAPEGGEYSEERMSMSVEVPEVSLTKQHQHYAYKREPADPAVWRIDYAKHGGPSLNLLGSLTKTQGAGDESRSRKDVLHPDVYIKKNFVRKNSELVD